MQALEWLAQMGYKKAILLDYDNFLLKRDTESVNTDLIDDNIIIYFGKSSNRLL